MYIRKSAVVTLLVIFVVLFGVGTSVAVGASNPWVDEDELSLEEIIILFGNGLPEHNNQPFIVEEIEDEDVEAEDIDPDDIEEIRESVEDTTYKWDRPPETPDTWNENNFDDHTPENSPSDQSTIPEGSDYVNDSSIRYAHLTIHSISPSTKAHYHNRTETLMSTEGTARSSVDYLVDVPPDEHDDDPPGEDVIEVEKEYSLDSTGVTRYELLADGNVVDSVDSSGPNEDPVSGGEFEFDDLYVDGDTETLSVEAEISVRFEVEKTVTEEVTISNNETGNASNGNETTVERTDTETEYEEENLELEEDVDVNVEDLSSSEFELFVMPEDRITEIESMVSYIQTPRPFSGFEVDGIEDTTRSDVDTLLGTDTPPDRIDTGWTFMTTRDIGWDQATNATIEDDDTIETEVENTSASPVQRHVYPTGHQPSVNTTQDEDEDDEISFPRDAYAIDDQNYATPDLPAGTNTYTRGNYTEQRVVETTHMRDITDQDVEVYGFVDNEPYTISEDDVSVTQVEKGNITVEINEVDNNRDRPTNATITLKSDSTGQNVDHSEVGGEVLVSDFPDKQSVDLGSDGETTVRTNTTGTIVATYEPPKLTESERPLTEDRDYTLANDLPSVRGVVTWAIRMAFRLMPLLLALYLINAYRDMVNFDRSNSPR